MTICIAAACRDGSDHRIVLCCDTMLDYDFTSTNQGLKAHVIGRGWAALIAGHVSPAIQLTEELRESFASADLSKQRHVVQAIISGIDSFKTSGLFYPNCCQLLISGFIGRRPVVIGIVADDKGELGVSLQPSFGAVGTGATVATAIMNQREYGAHISLETAVYLVFEAKKFSEKASGVGATTFMFIQMPHPDPAAIPDKIWGDALSHETIRDLDAQYKRLGLQPITGLKKLDSSSYLPPPA